jgi:type II secretory pathway component PulF
MALYNYKALNKEGGIVTGQLESVSKKEAGIKLNRQNLLLINLQTNKLKKLNIYDAQLKVSRKAVLVFTKQLLSLSRSGLPLVDSLTLLTTQTSDINLKNILIEICEEVKSGKSFSAMLQRFPHAFSELYINSIYVGEVSGNMDNILQRLVEHIENETKLKKDLKKAFRYPSFVVSMLITAFIIFISFVIPRFEPVFKKSQVELPFPTRFIMSLSDIFNTYGFILLLLIMIFTIVIVYIYKTDKGAYVIHNYILKIPIYGELLKKIAFQRFASTLALLISNGIPLVQALDTVIKIESNKVFKKNIKSMQIDLEKGQKIEIAMSNKSLFSNMMIHMVSIGEITGSIHEMLENAAEYSSTEINEAIENITVLIEPVVTIILAIMVLILALSIFLPMWNMLGIL